MNEHTREEGKEMQGGRDAEGGRGAGSEVSTRLYAAEGPHAHMVINHFDSVCANATSWSITFEDPSRKTVFSIIYVGFR